jgi:hypothetical protein
MRVYGTRWPIYGEWMCDLTADEKDSILRQLNALQDVVDQIKASARSIEERNWLEHDEVSQLLVLLTEKANEANHWVHQKVHATHG